MRPLLALLVLGAVAWLAWGGAADPGDDAPSEGAAVADEDDEPAPGLRGAGDAPAKNEPKDEVPRDVRALVAEMASGDADRQDAALKKLRAMHAKAPFPFEWFVRWALIEVPSGQSNPLVGWAISVLKEDPEKTKPFLAEILAGAVGAKESTQEAVGRLVLALRGGRYGGKPVLTKEHVPTLVKIFDAEGSGWGIKRDLISSIDGMGADLAPLIPSLVRYVDWVLADRRVAAKEAAEAGIMVSWDHVEYDVEQILGSIGAAGVPKLVEMLRAMYEEGRKDDEGYFDQPTSVLMGALAGAGEEGIRAVIAFARDPRERVRSDAAWALRDIDDPHEGVRGALIGLLKDDDSSIRERAAGALANHGDASIPDLLRALQDADASVRRAAAKSLSSLGVEADDVMAQMLTMLAGEDRHAAITAANTIASFGRDGVRALPDILARMDTDDTWLRSSLGAAAARLVPLAPQGIDHVLAAWGKASAPGRHGLLQMLAILDGPDGKGGRRMLDPRLAALFRTALGDAEMVVRIEAAAHLAPTKDARVVEILRRGFEAKDGAIRTRATEGLAQVGGAAADLLPRLIERVQQEDLWHPGPAADIDGSDERFIVGDAIADLGRFDNARMFELLDHENWDLSYAAQQSFDRQGLDGYAYLASVFAKGRTKQKIEALDAASSAFFKQGPKAPAIRAAARPLIQLGLEDPDPRVRLKAVESLRKDTEQRAKLTLPVLVALLDVDDDEVVSSAAYRLSLLGKDAGPARDAIASRIEGKSKPVARTLRKLVEILDGDPPK